MGGLIPFYFNRLSAQKFFISNLFGGWKIVDEIPSLEFASSHFGRPDFRSKGFGSNVNEFKRSAILALSTKYKRALTKPSLIMVVPTLRCDHSCTYCQVSRAPLSSESHDLRIPENAIAKVINQIAAPVFKLEIQGGEPLLRTAYIQRLVDELREKSNKSFEVVITTALGPPLEITFLEWAKKNSVSFSISFDGVRAVHDKQRRWIKSNESQNLLNQIELLKSAGLGHRLAFVNTITKDLLSVDPKEMILEVSELLGVDRLFSRPISNYGFAATTRKALGYNVDSYLQFMNRYLDSILEFYSQGKYFFDDSFGIYLGALFRPEDNGHVDFMNPSGYGLSAAIVNYDGKIFGADEARMLYETTHNTALPIGQINRDGSLIMNDSSFHEEVIAQSFKETKPHCDLCAYSPFCGSDPLGDLVEQGDVQGFMPSSDFCKTATFMFDAILSRYADGRITDEMVGRWLG